MSFGNSYNGGRTTYGTVVVLNVYDLSPVNESCLYTLGLGVHHSGIEIQGVEYSFASGGGIFDAPPKQVPNARFRESIQMGSFDGGESEVRRALRELAEDGGFGSNDYNLVRRNCNHFANALCWKLLRKTIPAHVNRLADLGSWMSCLLPRKLLEDAPVNPNGKSGSESSSGFQVYGRPGALSQTAKSSASNFSGSGARLGSNSNTATHRSGLLSKVISRGRNASKTVSVWDDPQAKREKARQAALARFEKSAD